MFLTFSTFHNLSFVIMIPLLLTLFYKRISLYIIASLIFIGVVYSFNEKQAYMLMIYFFLYIFFMWSIKGKNIKQEIASSIYSLSFVIPVFLIDKSFFQIDISKIIILGFIMTYLTYSLIRFVKNFNFRKNKYLERHECFFILISVILLVIEYIPDIYTINTDWVLILMILFFVSRIDYRLLMELILFMLVISMNELESIQIIFLLFPVSLSIVVFKKLKKYKAMTFLISNLILMILFSDYSFLIETIIVTLYLHVINLFSFIRIKKVFNYDKAKSLEAINECRETFNYLMFIEQISIKYDNEIINKDINKDNKRKISECINNLKNNYKNYYDLKDEIRGNLEINGEKVSNIKIVKEKDHKLKISMRFEGLKMSDKQMIEIINDTLKSRFDIVYKFHHLITDNTFMVVKEKQFNDFKLFVKQVIKKENICGDSYDDFKIGSKRYILISDGMGSGIDAFKRSSNLLVLIKELIRCDIKEEEAIYFANMLVKEEEKFVTLDLLVYDKERNVMELYKNGSGVTYLKKGKKVEKIDSEDLPLGIVNDIGIRKINLNPCYDQIVFTSDGVKDIKNILEAYKNKSGKKIIKKVFSKIKRKIDDDKTILLINFMNK